MTQPVAGAGVPDVADAELARRIAAGDQAAFKALMRRHNRALFRTARAILRDDAEAEDALQEGYLQIYRTIGSYRGEARLSSWLARVVANEALMRVRKHARRSAIIPLEPGVTVEEGDQTAEGSMGNEPERSAQRAEMRKILEKRIDALPGAYRTVFVLRAVEEYSVEDTAAILQIPEATVRSRLFRARRVLREGLASEVDLACEEAFGFAGERCDRVVVGVMERLAAEDPR